MESGRTWNDNAGIAGGLVWMHGNSGDMDAGGWHAIGGISCPDVSEKRSVQMKEIAEVYGNGFLQIAGGIGALLLFFHAVDGQGMIGMVLRYYMTGICGS